MEEKVKLMFMVVLFDENDSIIKRFENALNINSNIQPISSKQFSMIIDNNYDDIIDIIKEYVKTQYSDSSKELEKINYMIINFFTERWDYLTVKEINF